MDALLNQLHEGRIAEAMGDLAIGLFACRAAHSPENWKAFVNKTVLTHPLRELIHRDPFTYRSFSKPRGYAGDAVMLDMIYRSRGGGLDDPFAYGLFAYATNRPAPCAVRNRAQKLADLIDETVTRRPEARILVLAAGHLREIELTKTVNDSFRGEIVALDQDAESLSVVDHDYTDRGVRVLHGAIKHVLAGKLDLRGFDLVYAAGLLDYLPKPLAKALCEKVFGMLNPRGRMLVANFVPGIPDVGYMESFMGWHLIYRDESDMRDLAAGIPRDRVTGVDLSFDGTRNVVYLSVSAT